MPYGIRRGDHCKCWHGTRSYFFFECWRDTFLVAGMTISFLFADMDNDVTNSPLQPILLMGRHQKEATNLAQTFSSLMNSTKISLFQTIFKIIIATQNNIQSLFLKNIQYQSSNTQAYCINTWVHLMIRTSTQIISLSWHMQWSSFWHVHMHPMNLLFNKL